MKRYNFDCFSIAKNSKVSNEDSILCPKHYDDALFFAIADGVGGNKYGHIASQKVIEICKNMIESFPIIKMDDLLEQTWKKFIEFTEKNLEYSNCATTLTVCKLKNNNLSIGHIGDCRLYILSKKDIYQATKDQTLAKSLSDHYNVDIEHFSHLENILESSITRSSKYYAEFKRIKLRKRDKIFLCTDGVYKTLAQNEIFDLLSHAVNADKPLLNMCKKLESIPPQDDFSAIYIDIL